MDTPALTDWIRDAKNRYPDSTHGTPEKLHLATLRYGLTHGHSSADIRRALLNSDIGLPSRRKWFTLAGVASRSLSPARSGPSGSSAGAADATRLARRLVGHLLSPVPDGALVSPRMKVTCRRALVVVAAQALADLHDGRGPNPIVTTGWLAVRLGVSENAARTVRQRMVDLGWLVLVKELPRTRSRGLLHG